MRRELVEALQEHPRVGWFFDPRRGLERRETRATPQVSTWIGEREDKSLELIREPQGQAALELQLNELRALGQVEHKGFLELLWTARLGEEGLLVSYRWRPEQALSYPLDLRWLLRSFASLSRAVHALHKAGLVHADLKPEAVRWAEDPEALQLQDLRMAQEPGPRRFEAYSARFAAPEQVAGGELDARTDVYALGVMLYSLFIRDRFPSILLPKGTPALKRKKGQIQQAELSAVTAFCGFPDESEGPTPKTFMDLPQQVQNFAPPPPPIQSLGGGGGGEGGQTQAILGAKILFSLELARVVNRTADIGVAKELLGTIERATAQKPAERYPDAGAFAEELARLLALAEELAG